MESMVASVGDPSNDFISEGLEWPGVRELDAIPYFQTKVSDETLL